MYKTEYKTIFTVSIQCNIYTEQTHGKMGKLGLLAATGRAQPQPPVGPFCACPAWLDLQDCTGQSLV
jgi:hypothetical protein